MALNKQLLYSGPVVSIVIDGSVYIYYTLDGVAISFETEWIDIHTDQIPGVTKKKKANHKIIVSFKVPELSFDMLKYALSQPDANISGDTMDINLDERPLHSIFINIPQATGRVWKFVFDSCVCLGATEIVYKKGEQTAWEIKFEAIWKSAQGRWGYASKT